MTGKDQFKPCNGREEKQKNPSELILLGVLFWYKKKGSFNVLVRLFPSIWYLFLDLVFLVLLHTNS